ncbi:RNA polymerase-associated protein RapA [Idiomarina sp.]|uniref:RNA polymerase-associated protein RapA n=1 Tax=Idiomarina sp. TaxID=1874361 RepID=UPI0025C61704|nr:RNA polymerase-associated protein RapA [Idiomarina sp.]NQZ05279.1 RNA polymerase-associated protein RapA [Idiomarina sp.]
MSEFSLGQRWLSETETDLGLGVVTAVDGRQVSVMFPSTGETRMYAKSDAPLARFVLNEGQEATHADQWRFVVTEAKEHQGLAIYFGERLDSGEEVMVPESQLAHQIDTNPALTRFIAGQADRHDLYLLRMQGQQQLAQWQQSTVTGLLGARVNLLPHQCYVASTVANRYHPRVMLADEVGLGKTIEAGMIIKRQHVTGRSRRVLVAVPDSLRHQWLVEMRRRFALDFSVFDEARIREAQLDSDNPFSTEQLVIINNKILHDEQWHDALMGAEFDMLVVDEAHHLNDNTPGYEHFAQLAKAIPGLLLLTATPEQEGNEGHFKRLQLLDPDRFNDFNAFEEEQTHYRELAEQANNLSGEALDELLDEHGTGRVMFRNRRQNVGGFPARHFHSVKLPEPEDDMREPWWLGDPRVTWLIDHIKSNRDDKTLLICHSAKTVNELAEALRVLEGINAAVFHEGMSLLERDRAAEFFADDDNGSPVLLCSEIGSEGRNFQFVHQLVLFDLPGNPDLLEQRIGRLDRIGQTQDIQIYLPYLEDSDEGILLPWYHTMNAFEQCNPVGRRMYDEFAQPIKKSLLSCQPLPQEILQQSAELHQQLMSEVEKGRDKLQELNACRPQQAEAVISAIEETSDTAHLSEFMTTFWERFGIDAEELDETRTFVKPSEHMRVEAIPGLQEEGMTITFDRTTALNYEDVEFLSWDHPHVQEALDIVTQQDFGSVCVTKLNNKALPEGAWFMEVDFSAHINAPQNAVAQEFFPLQNHRILLDSQGRELTSKVPRDALTKQADFMDKKTSRQILKQLRDVTKSHLEVARSSAEAWLVEQSAAIRTRINESLGKELDRLTKLKQRNPSVRDSEIRAIELRKQTLLEALEQPQLSLFAVRILVNHH